MADAKSLVASLAMGADGINMGTRFVATKEAPVHENVKQAIVNATEKDTRLVMRPFKNTERVLVNPAVEKIIETEQRLGDQVQFDDIANEVVGVYPKVMIDGDVDVGAWSCGLVAGLIKDVPSCEELITGIVTEAQDIIEGRLKRMI